MISYMILQGYSPNGLGSVWILCVCALTMRPEVRATTLEMAYSMARACLWRLMCLSTTPCTRAPSRKLTWPMRTMLRPIFIRALVSSKDAQHIPEQGRKEEKQVNAPACKKRRDLRLEAESSGDFRTFYVIHVVHVVLIRDTRVRSKPLRGCHLY